MVNCGKRGSLPTADGANIIAAHHPLAAATASDDIQTTDFMISSRLFMGKRS
jgi:hypothetical protein